MNSLHTTIKIRQGKYHKYTLSRVYIHFIRFMFTSSGLCALSQDLCSLHQVYVPLVRGYVPLVRVYVHFIRFMCP
uniref:Uncharacterized protein n=1 Tax=Anguilla anguilla TaxID=7936 RepID=A0A0E9PNX9_ANGAN